MEVSGLHVAVLVAILSQGRVTLGQVGPCTTPRSEPGTCINIRECPPLLEMLRTQRDAPGVADFLRNSVCGGEARNPMVCCPQQSTPSLLPDPPNCGVTEVTDTMKIVGGQPSELGAWPWLAALGYRNNTHSGPFWNCAGALINNRYILTAAHCINPGSYRLIAVRLGDLDLQNPNDGATPIDVGIESTKVHEQYNRARRTDDIALIRLNNNVVYNRNVRPICLPKAPELRAHKFEKFFPFVAGWGSIEFKGPSSSLLLEVQVPVVDNLSCDRAYRPKGSPIGPKQLCAGHTNGGKDACQGDSGGPLMWPNGSYFYTIGVVSYGLRCAEKGFPGVYTRLTEYVDWIAANVK